MTDTRELVEQGLAVIGPHDDMPECVQRNLMVYVNMWQFREMLDTITAISEENRRLREALRRAEAYVEHGGDREGPLLRQIRAALSSGEASRD